MAKAKIVKCPECGEELELEDYLEVSDTTFCAGCDVELKIVRLDPPQVEAVGTIDEGDSDFDDESNDEAREF